MEVGEPPPPSSGTQKIEQHDKRKTKPNLYANWHQGPYTVLLASNVGSITNLHPMRVGKALFSSNEFPVQQITKIGRNRLELTFPTAQSANKFVQSDFGSKLQASTFIPFHKISIIGIAHGCANHASQGKRFSPPSTAVT